MKFIITLISIIVLAVACVGMVLGADSDPRLKEIQERRIRIQEAMGRAQEIYQAIKTIEQGEAELRKLTEEEAKVKAEKEKKE